MRKISKKYEYKCQYCNKHYLAYPSTRRGKTHACSKNCASEIRKTSHLAESNPNYKHGAHCTESLCHCGNTKDYRAEKCSECTKLHKPKEGYARDIEGIRKAIRDASSYVAAAVLCGVSREVIRKLAEELNIDISHFKVCSKRPSTATDIFKIHDKRVNSKVRKYLIDNEIFEYECQKCGLGDVWNGKIITLELDHINGVKEDNTLENLRFLCPNCHSQTETFRGANKNAKQSERS